ncbi:MAG: flagellar biosynthesis protein FlhB [Bacillota bacterium]
MASDKSFAQEKTEEATPYRRREARRKGQVAKSFDLNAAFNLFVLVSLLFSLQGYYLDLIQSFLAGCCAEISSLAPDGPIVLLQRGGRFFFTLLMPIFLSAFLAALVSNLVQVGFVVSGESLKPKWERLNPIQGFKRMFSLKTIIELVKNLLKVTVILLVALLVVKKEIATVLMTSLSHCFQGFHLGGRIAFSLAAAVIIAFTVIAGLDFFYQRYQYRKSLRMTKQEVKDEFKQTEGDPHFKAKVKERQRQIAFRRMTQEVPLATVVVTNPTHYAVALKYRREEMDAPRVVAKGANLAAERIKKIARENNVPILENKPVAQFLYRKVEIGDAIPAELYQAVAEILAVVYRKNRQEF